MPNVTYNDHAADTSPGDGDKFPFWDAIAAATKNITWSAIKSLLIPAPASLAQGDIIYYNGSAWARLGAGTAGKVLRTEGAAQNPTWGYPADLAIASQAQGDVIYFNGSAWVRLAPGTSGQFLKTNGAGANPAWENAQRMLVGHGLLGTVNASSTWFIGLCSFAPGATALDFQIAAPFAGTLKNFRIRTRSAQPGTGSLVFTVRAASSTTSITATVAAGGAAGLSTDLSNTAAVTSGQAIDVQVQNNATSASATIGGFSIEMDTP